MANITIDKIRNVCLLGHGGSGKTSLVEAMLHNAGGSDRFGKVADGTTVTDYDPEEIKRKISINTALAPIDWNGSVINVIDTPGYFDFAGEVAEGVRVSDGAVIVISGKSGVTVGAEKSWKAAKERNLPVMFFVNKMDSENANYNNAINQLKEKFGSGVAPFRVPICEGGKYCGYVNIVSMKAYKLKKDNSGYDECGIPADMAGEVDEYRNFLCEAVAETSEEMMERYFSGDTFSDDEMRKALREGVEEGVVTPVYAGSAAENWGVKFVLDAIVKYFPSPAEVGTVKSLVDNAQVNDLAADPDGPLSALVFKTIVDPYVGKMSLFRVYSGTIKSDTTVKNANRDAIEKIGRLFVLKGKKQIEVDSLCAGDIGAVTKLSVTTTGDTLCSKSAPVILEGIKFPQPTLSLAILPKEKGDEEKISSGLSKLMEEDPTFRIENNTETHEMVIWGQGEQHIDVIKSKLKSKFGVSVDLVPAKVPYRETIRKKVKVEGKHKKQSGGHGQYGHVWIEFEPGENEELEFAEKVFGGAVPKNFFPAVEKGLRECAVRGVLAGYPVVNLKATLVDGSYHPVDSSEMSFKMAAAIAYKEGLKQAGPVLLEPIGELTCIIPEEYMGDVIGDVNKRRGRVLGMNNIGGGQSEVVAEVPMSEMSSYTTDLRSMTQSRGSFTFAFIRYEEAPAHIAQKVMEEAKEE